MTRYQELYDYLNNDLDYRITHKNLRKALNTLSKQMTHYIYAEDIKNIYDLLDYMNCEQVVATFMEMHI